MLRMVEMLCGVFIGRAIAAERDSASLASAKVNPRISTLYAIFTFVRNGGFDMLDR
ncbi:MAG: hypothetical protein ACJAZY_001273 [Spirosomataceae bacterium]|jgi:hypothetical protein